MYNQNEYIKQYNKNSYKNIALRVKHDIYAMIEKYCNDMKILFSKIYNYKNTH